MQTGSLQYHWYSSSLTEMIHYPVPVFQIDFTLVCTASSTLSMAQLWARLSRNHIRTVCGQAHWRWNPRLPGSDISPCFKLIVWGFLVPYGQMSAELLIRRSWRRSLFIRFHQFGPREPISQRSQQIPAILPDFVLFLCAQSSCCSRSPAALQYYHPLDSSFPNHSNLSLLLGSSLIPWISFSLTQVNFIWLPSPMLLLCWYPSFRCLSHLVVLIDFQHVLSLMPTLF